MNESWIWYRMCDMNHECAHPWVMSHAHIHESCHTRQTYGMRILSRTHSLDINVFCEQKKARAPALLKKLDGILKGKEYLERNVFSVADVAVLYMHTYAHAHTSTHPHTHTHTHAHPCTHTHTHARTLTHACIHTRKGVCLAEYVLYCSCCSVTYTHTHRHTESSISNRTSSVLLMLQY